MKYLAIDTSNEYLAVLCNNEGKYSHIFMNNCGVKHSTNLMTSVETCLCECGLDIKDVDFIACVVGPGSFTGIRIGVATVKGLADGINKPVLPVTTFEVLAYNKNKCCSVVDAKHSHVYIQVFENGISKEPEFCDNKKCEQISKEFTLYSFEEIEGLKINIVDIINGLKNAVEGNLDKVTNDVDKLKPFYLRLSQAEEGRQ